MRARVRTDSNISLKRAKVLGALFRAQGRADEQHRLSQRRGRNRIECARFRLRRALGIKLVWQGLSGTTAYENGFSAYSHDYSAPLVHAKLADQGDRGAGKAAHPSHTADGSNRLSLGDSSFTLGKFWCRGKKASITT